MKELLPEDQHYARLARKRVSVSVLIFHENRVLVVHPTYEPHALLPGGAVDELESPRTAAIRECREELGLDVDIDRFLGVDHTLYPETYRGDCLHFMFLAKDFSQDQVARIRLPNDELRAHEFVTPTEAAAKLGRRIKQRLAAGVRARAIGKTFYSENGVEP
jgi:8-oxo-dGTP diphosphatase